MKANLGLKFNKLVYKNILNVDRFTEDSEKLIDFVRTLKLTDLNPNQLNVESRFPEGVVQSFKLETTGQGLLIGIGNDHGTGKSNHEFKMGFHFDHSTGIPIITGHSLKGRLSSFFPIAYKNENPKKKLIFERIKQDIKNATNKDLNESEIVKLEQSIFEGQFYDENEKSFKPLPLFKRDVFVGAFPSKSNHLEFEYTIPKETQNSNKYQEYTVKVEAGTFLFDDTLANHQHPLKDPVPLRFLKILNNVEITFQFILNDEGGLNKVEKEKLFEYLLLTYGVGAKTTSGYGQFKNPRKPKGVSNTSSVDGYIDFDNFAPIKINVANNIIPPEKNQTHSDNKFTPIKKSEQKRREELNNEIKIVKNNNIEKIQKVIEINKQYIGQVIEILPEGDFYKIKLNDLDIVLTRKVYKEARKNVEIVINKEYIVIFSTVVEPLQYTVSEKLK